MPILELYDNNSELPDTYHPYTLQRVKICATLETERHRVGNESKEVELIFDWKPIWHSPVDYKTGEVKDNYNIYTYEMWSREKQIDHMLCKYYNKSIEEKTFDDDENLSDLYFTENDIDYWMTVLPMPKPMCINYEYTINKIEILKRFELNELQKMCENNCNHYKCAYYCFKCSHTYNKYNLSPHIIHKMKRTMRKPHPNRDKFIYVDCKCINLNILQQFAREMNIDIYKTNNQKLKKKNKNELYDEITNILNNIREP